MKTSEIIATQIKHINSNFKEYFKMVFPLFIMIAVTYHPMYYELIEGGNIPMTIILILFSLYGIFYTLRYIVNVHRYVILNDISNYFSIIKKFKVTFFYTIYIFIIFLLVGTIVVSIIYLKPLIFSDEDIGAYILIIIQSIAIAIVFSFFALILPNAAVGEKTKLKEILMQGKKFRLTIFFLVFSVYAPFLIINEGLLFEVLFSDSTPSFFAGLAYTVINAIIYCYLLTVFAGCLSRIYMLSKETTSKNNI